jgi:NADPH2:quinone reductase
MTLPETMTCIEIKQPGGPEALVPGTRPLPAPQQGEVLIRVAAAGINRPDVIQRQGHYPPPAGASDIPGLEIAGTVAALGDGVTDLKLGDAVCALVTGGGYAQYCTAAAACCLPIPKDYDMVRAAALPETFFTVWHNVFQRARLQPGETFLVHGGTSGIGTTAIQLARSFGARVLTTAGSPDKCRACEKLGAERAINYREEDFAEVVAQLTNGKGVDVILDMVGGDYLPRNIKCLRADGRLVNIAFLKGSKVELNFMPVMLKRLTITGSTLRPQPVAIKATIAAELKEKVWPLLDAGRIAPVVHARFTLDEAAAAHQMMESSAHIGKIILSVA